MPLKHENRNAHKKYRELSVEQTIVPGRLNSELCAWGVKVSSAYHRPRSNHQFENLPEEVRVDDSAAWC